VVFSILEYLFLFWRCSCFCIISDDVIGGSTKAVQRLIRSISGNIEAVFFRLGAGDVHRGGGRMTPVVPSP